MSAKVSLLARYDALDRALVAAGFPPTSPWWRRELSRFLRSGKRRWVIRAGRRAGKSTTLMRLAACVALFGAWKDSPGDRVVVALVSVSKDECEGRLRTLKAIFKALGVRYSQRGDELEIAKRPVVFRVIAATTEAVVGFTSILIIGDEMARWESRDTAANPAREVMASLRPTMATQRSAIEIDCSSPWGQDDFHAEMFDAGDTTQQLTSFAESWIANPTLSEADTHELEPDPLIWSREYAAQPGATVSAALDPVDVAACFERQQVGAYTIPFIALDASSLRGDAFAYIAGGVTTAAELVVNEVSGWEGDDLRRESLGSIVQHIAGRAKLLGVTTVFGDQREEAGLSSLFAEHEIGFRSFAWSDTSKDDAVMLLRRMMREGKTVLCEHGRLRRELTGMKARLLPSGRTKYETNGKDFASCLITLAHAVVANDVDLSSPEEAAGRFYVGGCRSERWIPGGDQDRRW